MDVERDKEELQKDVEELRDTADAEIAQAKVSRGKAELEEEGLVTQKAGHMQGKANHWALQQEVRKQEARDAREAAQTSQAINSYNQQGFDLQQRQVEEAQKELGNTSMLSVKAMGQKGSPASPPTSLQGHGVAAAVGLDAPKPPAHEWHHHHHDGGWPAEHCDDYGCYDEYGGYWDEVHGGYYDEHGQYWEPEMKGYWDTTGQYYKKISPNDEAGSAEAWFQKCGQIRIPPSIIASRRAASEAYWSFDRSLALAERAVSDALTSARLKGE